jgi:2-oxoacid:acceptor oxidoreductase gamma subunit (pyruvate/2-ketoisovalerate family)
MTKESTYELIFHGRGGQGGVTGAQILAGAAILSEKFVDCSSFPSFGAERRGAPVEAYCRISNKKIWIRSQIQKADMAVVLDETVFGQHIIDKLKPKSIIIMNTPDCPADVYNKFDFKSHEVTIATADLITVCLEAKLVNKENQPIVNTPILGVLTKVPLGLDLDDIKLGIENHFGVGSRSELNFNTAKKASEVAQVQEFK